MVAGNYQRRTPISKEDPMTLSLLMYLLMIAALASLAGVLVVDVARGLRRASARRASRAEGRPATSGARNRGAAPTTS
jgi:hypothetical protein